MPSQEMLGTEAKAFHVSRPPLKCTDVTETFNRLQLHFTDRPKISIMVHGLFRDNYSYSSGQETPNFTGKSSLLCYV
jgi:hypothetical protein